MTTLSKQIRDLSYSQLPDPTEKQDLMIRTLANSETGLTDKQLADVLAWDLSAVNSTRNRLVSLGIVTDNGVMKNTLTGKLNTVWILDNNDSDVISCRKSRSKLSNITKL